MKTDLTRVLAVVCLASLACSSDGDGNGGDGDGDGQSDAAPADGASGSDAANAELCAEPGAIGNSDGVGKYCQTNADCDGLSASLCTVVQQADAPPFCTKPCFDASTCGDEASCEGDGPIKGCTPSCLVDAPAN